jgi:hypothetical protein
LVDRKNLRSTYATRLSAEGVADEWVTQLLRQGDSQVFKKYSQMKLAMKREAHEKLDRLANEMPVNQHQSPENGGFVQFQYSNRQNAKEWVSHRRKVF